MGRTANVSTLEDHPNLPEVLGVLAQLAHISDADLTRLAGAWSNTVGAAEARDRALSPDSPLVCEVLAAFEAVQALFAEDVRGEAPYLTVTPAVAVRGLKAVRDAIAGAYAEPSLSRAEHTALMQPWRTVFAAERARQEPDLGPNAALVKALLAALPGLAARCHDADGQDLYDQLVDRSFVQESDREQARDSAFQAAVMTNRRRTWALVRRSGTEGLTRPCRTCRTASTSSPREDERVLMLCLDAVCALLVCDAVSDAVSALLIDPVSVLVPLQRRPTS